MRLQRCICAGSHMSLQSSASLGKRQADVANGPVYCKLEEAAVGGIYDELMSMTTNASTAAG